MIETGRIGPGLNVVAGLAACRSAIGPLLGHAIVEFALVGIHVASGATKVFEDKWQYFVGSSAHAFLVTFIAGNCCVRALQWVSRIAMHRDGEFRLLKTIDRMTGFTTVQIGSLRELPVMRVLVAIRALRKFDFVNRIRSGGSVALGALHLGVLA